jgi:hypothetical protein
MQIIGEEYVNETRIVELLDSHGADWEGSGGYFLTVDGETYGFDAPAHTIAEIIVRLRELGAVVTGDDVTNPDVEHHLDLMSN